MRVDVTFIVPFQQSRAAVKMLSTLRTSLRRVQGQFPAFASAGSSRSMSKAVRFNYSGARVARWNCRFVCG